MASEISYRRVLTVNFALIAVLPLLVFGVVAVYLITEKLENEASGKNLLIAENIASEVDEFLVHPEYELKQFAEIYEAGDFSGIRSLDTYMQSLTLHHQFFSRVIITNREGYVIHTYPREVKVIGHSMAGQSFFKKALEKKELGRSKPYISTSTGELSMNVTVPVETGIVSGYLNLEILKKITSRIRFGYRGVVFITDKDGVILAHSDEKLAHLRINEKQLEIVRSALNGNTGTSFYFDKGEEYLGSSSIIKRTGWPVIVTQPSETAFSFADQLEKLLWMVVLTAIICSALLAVWKSGRIIKPILLLAADTRRITRGEYFKNISSEKSYSEMEDLKYDFFEMVSAVKSREEELRQKHEELNTVKEYLKNVFNSMKSVLFSVDKNSRVTNMNKAAENFSGLRINEAAGKYIWDILSFSEEHKAALKGTIITRDSFEFHKMNLEQDFGKFYDISFYPLSLKGVYDVVIRIDDVTEKVNLEEIMIHQDRIMTVGELAAGMAHEIKNPLAGVIQSVQVIKNRMSSDLEKNRSIAQVCGTTIENIESYISRRGIGEMLEGINESGIRAARIVENMLDFSRKSGAEFDYHDICELIDKTIDLASKDYDLKRKYDFKQIEVITDYEQGLDKVRCQASKLQQVFLNILSNGAQAMTDRGPGGKYPRICITVSHEESRIKIEIEDNGPGMDEEVRQRVFEPFFTTKKAGMGTGLGLSVSHFIITENHGGTLEVESEKGTGTKFIIKLPS